MTKGAPVCQHQGRAVAAAAWAAAEADEAEVLRQLLEELQHKAKGQE
jgi:hypothetical protein